jgi:hypothetical protein
MNFALALVFKIVFLLILFGAARLLAMGIMRLIPPGKVRDFLMRDDGKFP